LSPENFGWTRTPDNFGRAGPRDNFPPDIFLGGGSDNFPVGGGEVGVSPQPLSPASQDLSKRVGGSMPPSCPGPGPLAGRPAKGAVGTKAAPGTSSASSSARNPGQLSARGRGGGHCGVKPNGPPSGDIIPEERDGGMVGWWDGGDACAKTVHYDARGSMEQ